MYIYIFIAIALNEGIFLDVLHSPMKNIKSCDPEATPKAGQHHSQPVMLFVYCCLRDIGHVSP